MRTTSDALRSMKRHVALVLGADWEVRFADEAGRFAVPTAVVKTVGPTLYGGPRHYADATQPMHVSCWPGASASQLDAEHAARAIEELLFYGFRHDPGPGLSRPARVPLFDYDGKPWTGQDSGSNARGDHDFLRVVDFSTTVMPDPQEERQVGVMADIRVTWRRPTRDLSRNLVESIRLTTSAVEEGV